MSAVIVVFTGAFHISQVIGPFDTAQEAADHNAGLRLGFPAMIVALTPPLPPEPCVFTHSHTREWCGHPGCREA